MADPPVVGFELEQEEMLKSSPPVDLTPGLWVCTDTVELFDY